MPPFILCESNCPKSKECYRFRASPDGNQLYHNFYGTLCDTNNNFNYHMKIRPEDQLIDLDLPVVESTKNTEDKPEQNEGAENGKENLHG